MASPISQLKGTALEVAAKTYAQGLLIWNETAKRFHGGDGVTAGGIPMARYDERNDGALGYDERIETDASNSVTIADLGKTIVGNRATAIAFDLDPAADLTAKFVAVFKNIGAGAMTVVPNGAELIDGVNAAVTLPTGSSLVIKGDGAAFRTYLSNADVTGAAINNAAPLTGANLADADKLGVFDVSAAALVSMTIPQFVAGIFRAARKIADGNFLSSFRLWDATDSTKGLAFDLSGIAAGQTRSVKWPNKDLANIDRPSLHVRDQKASGATGGASSAGINVRVLNTVVLNDIGASLAGNQITLLAGTYEVQASANAYNSGGHKAWLRTAGGAVLVVGQNEVHTTTGNTGSRSLMAGRFSLAATTAIEIAHYFTGANVNGLGFAVSSGQPETYAEVLIWKVD
ncbi:MAG: hypothetical protein ACK4M8_05405 [Allorhizobium sp.]